MFLDLLKQELGESKPANKELRFCCPFCGENDHKFYVHKDKGLWICFKCSESGNPLSFVKEYYNVSYVEAVDILATFDYDVNEERDNRSLNQYGTDLTEEEKLLLFISRQGEPFQEEVKVSYTLPNSPTNTKNLLNNFNNPETFPFFQYLNGRGVTLDQIKKHNMSYVIEGTVNLASGKKLSLYNHLIFYTFGLNGEAQYWNTRSIDPSPFIKSFNAPSREGEYSKNTTVFNLNNAMHTDKIIINEGVFDALTVGNSGVATFGKKVTDSQIDLIAQAVKKDSKPIYLFLDEDAAKETTKTVEKLRKKVKSPIYYVVNKTGMDANDLGPERCKELIENNSILSNAEGDLMFDILNLL